MPNGKTTDFQGAVRATADETVAFSWIEWPDKARRDNVMPRMDELGKTDERFDLAKNPMPFDGKRMIYGGFEPIVEQGRHTSGSYVQGFTVPVPSAEREAYREMAEDAWAMFKGYGALRIVEAWGDDVSDGNVTDFRRAVKAEPDERVVFSFMEWPSRKVCAAAPRTAIADPLRFAVAIKALPYRWPAALRRRVPCCSVCVDHAGAQRSVISYGR